tara:strand:- start:165 stop:581 length:417 start_codon:yes stop_codon:yes gene_type:complete
MGRKLRKLTEDELGELAGYQKNKGDVNKNLSKIAQENGTSFGIVEDSEFKLFDVSKEWGLSDNNFQNILSSMAEGCNKPYLKGTNSRVNIDGEAIYRPNHNSTHGARSVIYLEKLFKLQELRNFMRDDESFHAIILEY